MKNMCHIWNVSILTFYVHMCRHLFFSAAQMFSTRRTKRPTQDRNMRLSSVLVRLPLENGIYSLWYEKKSKCIGRSNLWEKHEQSKQWRPTELTTYHTHLDHIHSSIHPDPHRVYMNTQFSKYNSITRYSLCCALSTSLSLSLSRFTFNRFSRHFSQTGASSIILLAFIHAYIIEMYEQFHHKIYKR